MRFGFEVLALLPSLCAAGLLNAREPSSAPKPIAPVTVTKWATTTSVRTVTVSTCPNTSTLAKVAQPTSNTGQAHAYSSAPAPVKATTQNAVAVSTSAAAVAHSSLPVSSNTAGFRNVGYFVDWAIYARNFTPQQLPFNQLTHVLYAFANIQNDGTVVLADTWADLQIHYPGDSWNDVGNNVYGCIKQLYLLKKQNRNLKVMLSIGGWTYGPNFAAPASTAAGRAQFAASATSLVANLGLDGIDIDWEYPANAAQAQDFVLLLQALRSSLDAYTASNGGSKMEISVACPAGPTNYQIMQLKAMDAYLDFWNLMGYDYDGSWSSLSGHQANIYPSTSNPNATPFSTDAAIEYYISQGIAPSKINLGMPLYGRAFDNTAGPGASYSGIGAGDWENGIWDYKNLPKPGAVEKMDTQAGASYSYDSAADIMITYDTPAMAQAKVQYIVSKGLGGGMFWETSGDAKGERSLIGTTWNALKAAGPMDGKVNTLSYPASQYANLKAGMPSN